MLKNPLKQSKLTPLPRLDGLFETMWITHWLVSVIYLRWLETYSHCFQRDNTCIFSSAKTLNPLKASSVLMFTRLRAESPLNVRRASRELLPRLFFHNRWQWRAHLQALLLIYALCVGTSECVCACVCFPCAFTSSLHISLRSGRPREGGGRWRRRRRRWNTREGEREKETESDCDRQRRWGRKIVISQCLWETVGPR